MQNIQTFLWLNDQAEEAARVYSSAFTKAKTVSTLPGPGGKPMGVTVELADREFILFNGGPQFHPTASISFFTQCETPEEVDKLWTTFSDGGNVRMELKQYPFSERYGWIEDKFGINWQISLSRKPQSVAPTFMFNGAQQGRAEEAMNFYVTQFPNSSISLIARYGKDERGPEGQIKFSSFSLDGQNFSAMDSGTPMDIPFTPGISMFVNLVTQEEVDHYWDALSAGGRPDRCGWLQDKFGVSWQIIPTTLGRLLSDSNRNKAQAAMQAMLQMTKINIADLQRAYDQG